MNFRVPSCLTQGRPFRPPSEVDRLQACTAATIAGPSSNGRTADFGSVNGGSNPPGPIEFTKTCSSLLLQFVAERIGRIVLTLIGQSACFGSENQCAALRKLSVVSEERSVSGAEVLPGPSHRLRIPPCTHYCTPLDRCSLLSAVMPSSAAASFGEAPPQDLSAGGLKLGASDSVHLTYEGAKAYLSCPRVRN
jgi:hypothetical protein